MKWQEIIFSHLGGGGGCFPIYAVDNDNDNDSTALASRLLGGARGLKIILNAKLEHNLPLSATWANNESYECHMSRLSGTGDIFLCN